MPFIGSRAKVSEVLSGKRQITMPMARALHEHLGIPTELLLQERGVSLDGPLANIEWNRFPVKAMAKRDWISKGKKAEAAARGISMSRCVGDVIREYFALRQEMLSVMSPSAVAGDGHPGLQGYPRSFRLPSMLVF